MNLFEHDGRCCRRKPLLYKRDMGRSRAPYYFCHRCDREFDGETGEQRPNFKWALDRSGRWCTLRVVPVGPGEPLRVPGRPDHWVYYAFDTEEGERLMRTPFDDSGFLDGGIRASDHLHVGTNDDTCSRCRRAIREDEVPLMLWVNGGNDMYIYCNDCDGLASINEPREEGR